MGLLACLAIPVTAGDAAVGLPHVRYELENGLTVILQEDHSTPMVAVNIWYHVGSGHEKKGRTGFAHLFEHILFEGSEHVPEGKFDEWLETVGGNNNGSTTIDRTNYFEILPSHALEMALFLESDRMGWLLGSMSEAKVDGQRDVVKNERRQRVENAPYGMVWPTMSELMFPEGHPYSWPTIGYMEDLSAASYEDVVTFFKTYYGPNNASLVIVGDIEIEATKKLVEKWFGEIPRGQPIPAIDRPGVNFNEEKRVVLEDRVQLERVHLMWHSPPAFSAGAAGLEMLSQVLAGGKTSRLYKRLVYDLQIAQDVFAFNYSGKLGSTFIIGSTASDGHTAAEVEKVIDEEMARLLREPPTERELKRAFNQLHASTLDRLEGIEFKADILNRYYFYTGNPDYLNEWIRRLGAVDSTDLVNLTQTYLKPHVRGVITVVPKKEDSEQGGKGE